MFRASCTLLLLLGHPQEKFDDFQKRVRAEGTKVAIDDRVIYEGPWKTADVSVRLFKPFKDLVPEGFVPWYQVILTIDGEERLRLPVPSLKKLIAFPPVRHDELRPSLKKLTETVEGKKTFVVLVSTEKAEFEIYRGPVAETRVERKVDSFVVFMNGEVLYRVARTAKPSARPEDVLEAVNAYREQAGVGKVKVTPALSRGCDLHALYLTKNDARGLSGHDEDPKGVGFTEEGAKAGKRSVITPFASYETPREGLESLMATLYHRVAVLHPQLTEVGIGWAFRKDGNGHLVMDVGSLDPKEAKGWPVCWPPPGQKDVPLEFGLGSRETPNPLPDGTASAGYPITIQYPEGARPRIRDPKAQLTADGQELACWISTPEDPARADWPQAGVTALIPKEKLKPGTTCVVKLRDRLGGEDRMWAFTTVKQ